MIGVLLFGIWVFSIVFLIRLIRNDIRTWKKRRRSNRRRHRGSFIDDFFNW